MSPLHSQVERRPKTNARIKAWQESTVWNLNRNTYKMLFKFSFNSFSNSCADMLFVRPRWRSLHTIDEIHDTTQNHRTRCFHFSFRAGLRLRPRWGSLHIPLMKSMTHYSESLHQMLPFMSKMHQNRWPLGLRPRPRWGAYSAPPGPLAVNGWDGDLVTTLMGVDFDMCPLACDRCPLAVLRLATGLRGRRRRCHVSLARRRSSRVLLVSS